MTLVIPHQAEEIMLDLLLAVNYTLRLYKNDVTAGKTEAQLEALTEASFTEASFTGYAAKALTGGSWVTTQADPSTGTYASQTFASTANQTAQPIYGYSLHRTSDNKLMWFEDFAGPLTISLNGDTIAITPTLTLDDDQEADVAARGQLYLQDETTDSPGYTASGTTDLTIAGVVVDSTRNYEISLHTAWAVSTTGRWLLEFQEDGVTVGRGGDFDATGLKYGLVDSVIPWAPTSGTKTVSVRAVEVSGTSTLTLSGTSSTPRWLRVADVGPR